MTAAALPRSAAEPEVDPAARALLLTHLGRGHDMQISIRMSGLERETAWRLAQAWGWPDKAAVRDRYLREMVAPAAEVPSPRDPADEAEPSGPEPDDGGSVVVYADPDPALVDHPAVGRALSLARLVRDKDPDQIARLTGGWSQLELLETCLALAALVPLGVEPEVALEWLDRDPEDWPPSVVAVEAGRWDAGARDATAEAAHLERERRGS